MSKKASISIAIALVFLLSSSYFSQAQSTASGSISSSVLSKEIPYSDVMFLGNISSSVANYSGNMNVILIFNFTNENALQTLLANLSNPFSQQYQKFLTASQFNAEFAPSSSIYSSAVSYFNKYGLWDQQTFQNRLILSITGSAVNFSEAFKTNFSASYTNGVLSYGPSSAPQLPSWLAGSVNNIIGLSSTEQSMNLNLVNYGSLAPAALANFTSVNGSLYPYPNPVPTQNGIQLLYGSYLQVAYNETPLLSRTLPTNQVIATILWGGSYTSNGNTINTGPYNPSDIYYYFNHTMPTGQPKPRIIGVPVNGALPPGTSAANDTSGAVLENTLDLEMAGSLAPGASIYNVYGPNSTFSDLTVAFNTILSPPKSYSGLANVSVISNSWGSNDTVSSAWNLLLQECQARGITVLASSGDSGNSFSSSKSVSNTEYVQFPSTLAYDTYGVVAVGGTNLSINPVSLALQSEQAWYLPPSSTSSDTLGTVGGISNLYAEPSWQYTSQANVVLKGSGRGVPDVSAIANNTLVYYSNVTHKGLFIIGGTSISSPVVGGIIAEMNAYRELTGLGRMGFINPSIYMLGTQQYDPGLAGGYTPPLKPFYDVTLGHNAVYSALPGYDLVTGMGSINAYNFVTDLSGKKFNVSFRETGLNPTVNWTVVVSGQSYASQGEYVNLSLINGTYYFEVPVVGYNVSDPVAGQFTVHGSVLQINLQFKRGYAVNFFQSTLPPGKEWTISVWNYTKSSFTQQLSLYFPNGTYNYTVKPSDPNYYGSSGNFSVNGAGSSLTVNFTRGIFNVTFVEQGLPPGYNWNIHTANESQASTNSTIRFTLLGGEYTFNIPPTGLYIANHTKITMNTNGQNQTVYLKYGYGYYVTFNAVGVALGDQWNIVMADYNITSSNSSITVEVQNGTYLYYAYYQQGATSNLNGNVTVTGSNLTVNLDFSPVKTPIDYYMLYIALFVLGVAILIIGLLMLRKR